MIFKVLIVEDEKAKASGIAYMLEKYNQTCSDVMIAYDGHEGYEAALQYEPDIILTDIRMPVMDGLEMIRKLKTAGVQASFIVLSGYAEFSYAKQAIELGVKDFITKPVDEMELSITLNKVCREISDRKSSEDSLSRMNDDMRNYVLRDFLVKGEDDQCRVREYLEQLEMIGRYTQYTCMILECEEQEQGGYEWIADGQIEQEDAFLYGLKIGQFQMAVIAVADDLGIDHKKVLAERCMDIVKEDECVVSIGIGRTYSDYIQLSKSYEESCIALNYRILKGSSRLILYEQLSDIDNQADLITEKEIEQLKERIDRFDQDGFCIAVKGIFNRVLSENQLTLPDLQKLSLNIVLLGLHNIPLAQLQMNEYFGRNLFTLKSIEKFRTIEQLENWIINMVGSMNELMLKSSVPKKKDVIAEIKEYIRQHYDQNITLNDISEHFYINPSYFSQLFKKKTGMTYQAYLTDYRIDRAKKLLSETDLRIYEVCQLVGYSDVNHFNQVFDRAEGMKPNEYRRRYSQQAE